VTREVLDRGTVDVSGVNITCGADVDVHSIAQQLSSTRMSNGSLMSDVSDIESMSTSLGPVNTASPNLRKSRSTSTDSECRHLVGQVKALI